MASMLVSGPGIPVRERLTRRAEEHKYAFMRTTIDLPDYLYRELKSRAALGGLTVRELITRYLGEGLHARPGVSGGARGRSAPPVAIPATGKSIRALSRAELRKADQDLEVARDARSARR